MRCPPKSRSEIKLFEDYEKSVRDKSLEHMESQVVSLGVTMDECADKMS